MQGAVGAFLKQYQRRAQRNCEPNDRQYDRDVEKKIKSLDPWTLHEIMYDDGISTVPREIEEHWSAGDRIDGIDFYYNDAVSVTDGPHIGKIGVVVSLTWLQPEPQYLIELGDGTGDIRVVQSKLKTA